MGVIFMSTANHVIQVRVNKSVKDAAASVAAGIGIPLSTLVNAFVTRLAWEGKMPFELTAPLVEDYFSHEKTKMQMFRQMVLQSEKDIASGNLLDGETFMQELLDGKHDE